MRKHIILFLVFFLTTSLNAQYLTGFASRWSDNLNEWEVFTDEENVVGELRMTWPMRGDWTDWTYRIGEQTGRIKIKWKEDLNEWEIRGDNITVTARTLWRDDFRQWRIIDGKNQLTFKSKYSNILEEWEVRDDTHGNFQVYTVWEGDPRDWEVIDELSEEISMPAKIGMAFLAILNNIPKE